MLSAHFVWEGPPVLRGSRSPPLAAFLTTTAVITLSITVQGYGGPPQTGSPADFLTRSLLLFGCRVEYGSVLILHCTRFLE